MSIQLKSLFMKTIGQYSSALLTALLFSSPLLSQDMNVLSGIDKVIVFRQGAEIERVAAFDLEKGIQEVKFSGLSPDLDPNSIQVLSDDDFTLLSVSHSYNYLADIQKPADLLRLIEKREILESSMRDLEMELALLNEEKNMLGENREVAGENDGLNLQRLKEFSSFFMKRMREIYSEKAKIGRELGEMKKEKEKLDQQIAEYEKSIRGKRVAEVNLHMESPGSQRVEVRLQYVVRNAGWTSGYDLRANSNDDDLEMIRFANIFNRTEIPWDEVDLVLSTGNPVRRLHIPKLQPWWLRFQEIRARKDLENAKMQMDGVMIEAAGVPQGPEVAVNEQLVTTLFDIEGKQIVPADGKIHRIRIQSSSFSSEKEYRCVPKLDPAVYLSTKLTGWEEAYLSPGEMKIYLDGAYVGKTYLDPAVTEDTLSVPLGIDEAINVKREKVTSYSKKQFLGKNISEQAGYRITIKSQRNRQVKILLEDQLPVSTHQDISVEIGETDGARYNAKTGLLSWDLELSPRGLKEIVFDFTVKYPKDKKINLY